MKVSRVLAVVSVLTVGVGGCTDKKSAPAQGEAASPPVVGVVTLAKRDLPLFIEAVASLDGYVNADIRARVRGYLKSQSYKDGAYVKAGETLFTIDASEYTVAVSAANAGVSRARTAQSRARIELDRDNGLFKTGNLSQQDLDNAKAALADADGQVQAAQAVVDQASLNLGYTNIRSPINGVAGVAQVRVGNLVGQDQPTLLAIVSQTDPIRVSFPLSEVDYVKYPERFKDMDQRDLTWAKAQLAKVDKDANDESAIQLILSDGSTYPHRGVIVTVNRNIDSSTGTIQMQALFLNPDGLLRPGQYGRIRMKRGNEGNQVIAVPERALVAVQGQYSVAVVGSDKKVKLQRVELGASVAGYRVVKSGVSEGDTIIIDGVAKVTDGAVVDPKPATDPGPTMSSALPPPSSAAPVGSGALQGASSTAHN
ncbi:MAG: efflux RND transporter periplasmic adaptor subunit [Polyangiaceae bacterium]